MGWLFLKVLPVAEVPAIVLHSVDLLCNCKGRAVRGLTSKKQNPLSFVHFPEVLFELAIIFPSPPTFLNCRNSFNY